MKKFIAISFLSLCFSIDGLACADVCCQHNYYLFSVFNRELLSHNLFSDRLDAYWKRYTGGKVDGWYMHEKEILECAKNKRDSEMLAYLTELNKYLGVCDELGETWDYPTKERLAARKQTFSTMIQKADNYRGERLKGQWMLLRMRANMVQGNHQANVAYWEQKASRQPASVYRDMMRNIYAGALMHVGRRIDACNEFASQGDMLSLKWAMRKYRNLAGIQKIYQENPNMPSLAYLVQDFVNNAQETLDQSKATDIGVDEEWMEEIDARNIRKEEADRFITFAKKVLSENKTKTPALWQAAIGELQYLYNRNDEAMTTLNSAMSLDGTERMKENVRAIRAVASVRSKMFHERNYNQWITQEIKWLVSKGKAEGYSNSHYTEVLDRLIYSELAPRLSKEGNSELALALYAVYENQEYVWGQKKDDSWYDPSWNGNYSGEYYSELDGMSGDKLRNYVSWMAKAPADELEQWVKGGASVDKEYFNDLIGTHYLAEGRFADAATYLRKVSPKFMEGQNFSWYLANRDYTKPVWIYNQRTSGFSSEEGANKGKLHDNPKLRFCEDIIRMESQFGLAETGLREKLAYQLATRLYQASPWGDCWYLTHYGWSCGDSAVVGELDYVARAVHYLEVSRKSTDFDLRQQSLYALAFIPMDPWATTRWDSEACDMVTIINRNSRQYRALMDLALFRRNNSSRLASYVTNCDLLKKFQ